MMETIREKVHNHITDHDNPHNVTKESAGLGKIENFITPSEYEARSGTIPNRYITPKRLKDVFNGILIRQGLMDQDGNVLT